MRDVRPVETYYAAVGVFNRPGEIGPPPSPKRRVYAEASTEAGAAMLAEEAKSEGWVDVAIEKRTRPAY